MSSMNMFSTSPRKARGFIEMCVMAGLVPLLKSAPGVGKSSIVKDIAKEYKLKIIDHRLSTSAPEDLTGLPRFTDDGRAVFAPFKDLFPLAGDPIPEGYDGWLLFLDELTSASKSVQAAAYKLILDRQIGQFDLHEKVVIVSAGNRDTDNAIVNSLGTAMQSRLVHLELEPNFREWKEDVALKNNYDFRIMAFLEQYPEKLMDFDPKHKEKTFCCPRTWEFMERLVNGRQITSDMAPLLSGVISAPVAMEFIQYASLIENMVTVEQILKDPKGANVPEANSVKYAVICAMISQINANVFDQMTTYAERYPLDFKILYYRAALQRDQSLGRHPTFLKALSAISQYLN